MIGPTQSSSLEASTTDFQTFLLEAIEAGSEMMLNFFSFEGERDERQRYPTGRVRICGRLNSSVRNKSNK